MPKRKKAEEIPRHIVVEGPIGVGKTTFARALAERLAGLKGRFLMTLNDHPEVRETFRGFEIEPVETTYTVSGGREAKRVREVVISG